MSISTEDRERISSRHPRRRSKDLGRNRLRAGEASSDATALPIFDRCRAALCAAWLLVAFTAMTVYRILSLQVCRFLVTSCCSFACRACGSR